LRDSNGSLSPLKGERIWVFKGDENLKVGTVSKPGGTFEIIATLKNGSYRLCIESKKYKGCATVLVKSYELNNVQILVEPLSSS
jgi:hypothetical protein